MPAHQPFSAIGEKVLSDGKLLTGIDWRAKRFVDSLAKLAAASKQAPRAAVRLLESGRAAVRHAAALLGCVTHAANNYKQAYPRADDTWAYRNMRDAQQPINHRKRQHRPTAPPPAGKALPQPSPEALAACEGESEPEERPLKRPRTARAKVVARRRLTDEEQTRKRMEALGASAIVSSHTISAPAGLEQLRQHVRARQGNAA